MSRRISITVELHSGYIREIKKLSKRWGVSMDDTIEDLLRRQLSKDERDERVMQIIRDAAAAIEKRSTAQEEGKR